MTREFNRNEMRRPPIATPDGGPHNFPVNHWWVAALSEEIQDGKLLARRFLGKSVVLYRSKQGEVVALENRCVHRAAPLSIGNLDGDEIVCRYHGFRYGKDGKCNHIPTQDKVPPRALVRSYPIIEQAPLVWIWMGDSAMAQVNGPPFFKWLSDSDWFIVGGVMPLNANYMSLKENVLDLTHFGFVHAATFKIDDWTKPPEVTVCEDNTVLFEQKFQDCTVPVMYQRLTGLGGDRKVNRVDFGRSLSPAIHEAGMEISVPKPVQGERALYSSRFLHITTPESSRSTHYWWFRGSDYGHDVPDAREWMTDLITKGFQEDKDVLEAIQAAADADPDYAYGPEISVEADRSGLQARRMLHKLIDAERSQIANVRDR